ncbi:hypothetical protein CMU85_10105 [Elizabethkingia anophelis]|uniref:hypothetical protein n=1 Tax=Elizabethkingia anophelis TaxID=1117645 RepID=UPI00293CA511|nr:hypothetical protein [Elizabethkingia anophelis]MDV3636971.1 hypothetical protein [Elizabethkingia anophelis]MDV3710138.1 hypothetical protein [Elizabethkingia anophelis]MDV3733645.1 hypothetical protein [Elizabethkingia anophelis]
MINLSNQISETIKNNKFQDLISDVSEVILDNFLEDGLIKDIPIFGLIFKSKNLYSSIQDKLFAKKLFTFLKQLNETSNEQRLNQIVKIDSDASYKLRVGEKLLYIINQAEDSEKAEYIGILFNAFLKEKIKYDEFLKTTNCINNVNTVDLNNFIKRKLGGTVSDRYSEEFLSTGLLTLRYQNQTKDELGRVSGKNKVELRVSKIGRIIIDVLSEKIEIGNRK